ncbi:MAG: hypothetical protein M3Q08_14660 [Pseudomonadota bacterium]|nr:hypothetical protein [Pseudomonadota bacterium]
MSESKCGFFTGGSGRCLTMPVCFNVTIAMLAMPRSETIVIARRLRISGD